ncbi:KpsF/GutQ family sugar-phosphate isomerase [Leuconostoc mesenteroides]|jgi:arabinose-5-phosphate isomerase|uniref:KpsF/GutQ family sugar-phosphate isomerase n=4 Tax=Lactobacillaceae TaxID=33958 RepID=A0A8B5QYH6_LEUME|nr:Sugar phosphate isomerase with CBS domains [Leuconostoc mesenteroides subsp. mesenteroides ATCC 8293]ARR88361.1 KpsF/GutQ family sugar-phosphate isomerase [Leuconostoc mesenteroides subsp. mesenteroides]EEJ42273.1 sugar isomerase, KpsF/GutQ family [Leuconostoc mesenteroides subsp. cremoris ATCC 19254]EQC84909.1 sugar phosphate isomerase [Leuconostoc mesenteroides subsp. cremoris TIFN8]KAA8347254.1 KpsF/GutQ family sugar-phosphate isomerase [Leuconostoc mesenteroides]ORI56665.1 KpsF/GutQ fam
MIMKVYYEDAKKTFDVEIEALTRVKSSLGKSFDEAVDKILSTKGRVIFIGIGKSGIIADKIAASFSSVGLASFYIDAGTAYHGDLGRVSSDDVVIFISNSGETQEVLQALSALQNIHNNELATIAMTGSEDSTLAKNTDIVLSIDVAEEADITKLAPTSSTTATLVMGDALLVAIETAKEFDRESFAMYHPGGSIGKILLQNVKNSMHTKIPYVHVDTSINEVIYRISDYGIGITLVKDEQENVIGIITDGDIRKKFLNISKVKGSTAKDYMTQGFISISEDKRNREAWRKMANYNISNLVVLDKDKKVVGVVTIHDVLE